MSNQVRRSLIVLAVTAMLTMMACASVNVTFGKSEAGWGVNIKFGGTWDHPLPVKKESDCEQEDAAVPRCEGSEAGQG